jgi:hypothetical protein
MAKVPNSRMNWLGAHMVSCRILTTKDGEIYRVILLPLDMHCNVRKDVIHFEAWINTSSRQMPNSAKSICDSGMLPYQTIDALDLFMRKWGVKFTERGMVSHKLIFLVEDYNQMRAVSNWLAEYEDDYVERIIPLDIIGAFINDHECEHANTIPFDSRASAIRMAGQLGYETFTEDPVLRARVVAKTYKRLLRFND